MHALQGINETIKCRNPLNLGTVTQVNLVHSQIYHQWYYNYQCLPQLFLFICIIFTMMIKYMKSTLEGEYDSRHIAIVTLYHKTTKSHQMWIFSQDQNLKEETLRFKIRYNSIPMRILNRPKLRKEIKIYPMESYLLRKGALKLGIY